MSLLFCFWGYIAVIYGAGSVFTQLQGKSAKISDVWHKQGDDDVRFQQDYLAKGLYEKRYFDGRKGCITRLTSPTLARGLPVYFCAEGHSFAQRPPRVAVTLYGSQSKAGFELLRIEYRP